MPNWKKLITSGSDASLSKLSILNTSTDDSLLIQSDDDTSSAAPVLTFKRNSSSPADADYLGQLKFKGENDADEEIIYAKITGKIQDVADGTEDGLIEFANKKAGSNVITARLRSDSFQLLNSTSLTVDGTSTFTGDQTFDGDADFNGSITGLGNFFVNASTLLYNSGGATITFATNGSMNIGQSGNTSQTTEVNGASLTVNAANTTLQDAQIDSLGIGTAASGTTGEIRATGDITAFYSSDERLKENIKPIENATDKVNAIGGYTFDWKEDIEDVTSKSGKDVGIIAQELEKVLPELVSTRDNGYKAVDYPKLVALLIQSNKELAARVKKLEQK